MTIDLPNEFERMPASGRVYMTSINFEPATVNVNATVSTDKVVVGAKHAIVLAFDDAPTPTEVPSSSTGGGGGGGSTGSTEGGGGEGDNSGVAGLAASTEKTLLFLVVSFLMRSAVW